MYILYEIYIYWIVDLTKNGMRFVGGLQVVDSGKQSLSITDFEGIPIPIPISSELKKGEGEKEGELKKNLKESDGKYF